MSKTNFRSMICLLLTVVVAGSGVPAQQAVVAVSQDITHKYAVAVEAEAPWPSAGVPARPVLITHINAEKLQARQGRITWVIAQPDPGTEYTVQRSADGMFFSGIGTVCGNNGTSFSFTDSFPIAGNQVFYHVLQTPLNGEPQLSRMVVLRHGEAAGPGARKATAPAVRQRRSSR